jgi:hypothetical protein
MAKSAATANVVFDGKFEIKGRLSTRASSNGREGDFYSNEYGSIVAQAGKAKMRPLILENERPVVKEKG